MRRNKFFILLAAVLLAALPGTSSAQSRCDHLQLSVGLLYERGVDATIGWHHEMKYHNAMEYFADLYLKYEEDPEAGHITKDSFWNSYRTWLVGIAYKPCVARGRNHHGNLRLGVLAGSDTEKIIGGGTVGYEHSYALYGGWQFFFQLHCDVLMRAKDACRTGGAIGIKIPLSR